VDRPVEGRYTKELSEKLNIYVSNIYEKTEKNG
jgi:hypothetical protein